jgi:uncharacterized protein
MRALILSGGVGHPFEATSARLGELVAEAGCDVMVAELEDGLDRLVEERFDLLAVNALRWRMTADRYAHLRDEWAFSLPEAGRAAIRSHVGRGASLLAVHTAAICFDDWPEWGQIVGGAWNWDRSSHPPLGEAAVTVAADAHPIVAGVDDFTLFDEVYGFLDEQPDVVPLMTSPHGGRDHPLLWARAVDGARVVYDALGHDERSYEHPSHRLILRRAVLWTLGADDDAVAAA